MSATKIPSMNCRSDATCIICREEMTVAKKLVCGHLFHVHCLRSWLERQHTCPTCRALVVPPEGSSTAGGHQGLQSDANQQGSCTNNNSIQFIVKLKGRESCENFSLVSLFHLFPQELG